MVAGGGVLLLIIASLAGLWGCITNLIGVLLPLDELGKIGENRTHCGVSALREDADRVKDDVAGVCIVRGLVLRMLVRPLYIANIRDIRRLCMNLGSVVWHMP